MRAYHSMTTHEFVAQLREIAIKANARPLVVDQIDAIVEGPTKEEIEERCGESYDEGKAHGRGQQWEECFDLLDSELCDYDGISQEAFEHIKALMCSIQPKP